MSESESESDYGPPVDQLLRLPIDLKKLDEWHDYVGMGLTLDNVPELARMAVDQRWDALDSDQPVVWAPMHARRALGVLRADAAIPALLGLFRRYRKADYFDEWIVEEVPQVLGMIGPAAIPELTALLDEESGESDDFSHAASSLVQIAKRHPEVRDEVVAIITRVLERGQENARTFNGFLISDLVDLEAKESAGAIERAFADDAVDESIAGNWYDVWHLLELEGDPPPKPERRHSTVGRVAPGFSPSPTSPGETRSSSGRAPVDRKVRNKAKLKLEQQKKARKRNRKR
jgi:hypothetical protein